MSDTNIRARLHTDAVVRALTAAFSGTPTLVGDGEPPAGSGWQGQPGQSTFVPYVMVFPMGTASDVAGDLVIPDRDATLYYQVTSVGPDRQSCEDIADVVSPIMLSAAATITVPGRAIAEGSRTPGVGGARHDETIQPPLWFAPDRFTLSSTPA